MLEPIKHLVEEILSGHAEPWPSDITDLVFLAIEHDQDRLRQYDEMVDTLDGQEKKGVQIVNQYIGKVVKQSTTGVNRGRCYSPRSSLIKSYQRH